MKKITASLLAAALVTGGCGILPEAYDDPFADPIEFGYYRYSPLYYWPVSYTYGCRGYYGPDGACYYYQRPYTPVQDDNPADEPAIPETQPRVMATGDPRIYVSADAIPQTTRSRMYREPNLSSARRMARPEPRVRSQPTTSSRPARSTRPSQPPRHSAPRQAPARSEPETRDPVRVRELR